jgi:hypothetical protein
MTWVGCREIHWSAWMARGHARSERAVVIGRGLPGLKRTNMQSSAVGSVDLSSLHGLGLDAGLAQPCVRGRKKNRM